MNDMPPSTGARRAAPRIAPVRPAGSNGGGHRLLALCADDFGLAPGISAGIVSMPTPG